MEKNIILVVVGCFVAGLGIYLAKAPQPSPAAVTVSGLVLCCYGVHLAVACWFKDE